MASENVLALPSIFTRVSLEAAERRTDEEVGQQELRDLFDELVALANDPDNTGKTNIEYREVLEGEGETVRYKTTQTVREIGMLGFIECDDHMQLVRYQGQVSYRYTRHFRRGQWVPASNRPGLPTARLTRHYDEPGLWLRRQVLTPNVYTAHRETFQRETERRVQSRRSVFRVAALALKEADV
jgi:hypothetical protein